MTEREKRLNGEFYDSRDEELIALYHQARKILMTYNYLDSELSKERDHLLTGLFEYKGKGVWIEAPFFCDDGVHMSIGENTFVNTNCFLIITR